jgi:hypothetical protein
MWLARIFGGLKPRVEQIEDEEPARFPVDHAADITTSREQRRRASESQAKSVPPAATKPGGFDPYNSGTFKKENAWERVTRK